MPGAESKIDPSSNPNKARINFYGYNVFYKFNAMIIKFFKN